MMQKISLIISIIYLVVLSVFLFYKQYDNDGLTGFSTMIIAIMFAYGVCDNIIIGFVIAVISSLVVYLLLGAAFGLGELKENHDKKAREKNRIAETKSEIHKIEIEIKKSEKYKKFINEIYTILDDADSIEVSGRGIEVCLSRDSEKIYKYYFKIEDGERYFDGKEQSALVNIVDEILKDKQYWGNKVKHEYYTCWTQHIPQKEVIKNRPY